jgi:hypothetical protein
MHRAARPPARSDSLSEFRIRFDLQWRGARMMAFRPSDVQEAFFVPGSCAFRVYGYGTTDPLEQVLAEGRFQHGTGLLLPGSMSAAARRKHRPGRLQASRAWPW